MKKLGLTFLTVLALAFVALPSVAAARQITTVGPAFNIFTGLCGTQILKGVKTPTPGSNGGR